jgi:hypothetical protein
MTAADVSLCETAPNGSPGYIARRIAIAQSHIDSRLRKRYIIPLPAPVSEIVLGWIVDIVTYEAFDKRGRDSADPIMQSYEKKRDKAFADLKEAADSDTGLFDLPLNESMQTSGIGAGGPLGTSQASPYEWIDDEAEAVYGCR